MATKKAKCGARTKSGTPCERPAGWGTETPGEGVCRSHLPLVGSTEGELAFYVLEDLQNLAKKHKAATGDPFDLSGDLAAARATRDLLIRRADDLSQAVLMWAAKRETKPPKSMTDLDGYEVAQRLWGQIAKMVEVQMKREKLDSLSQADVVAVFTEYGEVPGRVLSECLETHLPELDRSKGAELVGDFTRKVASAWQSLATGP